MGGDLTSESTRAQAIRLVLGGLGYIEGQNIATEYRYAERKPDRYAELAVEVVRLKVDLIVVSGGATPFALQSTKLKSLAKSNG